MPRSRLVRRLRTALRSTIKSGYILFAKLGNALYARFEAVGKRTGPDASITALQAGMDASRDGQSER